MKIKSIFKLHKWLELYVNSKYAKKLDDVKYTKLKYRAFMKKKLNLDNPVTYNEKIQWLKLYDHNPLYATLVDKYEVKEYVSKLIGEEYIIPTLGVWDSFDDIDFDALSEQFVLKCTHDSGGLIICTDKSKLDKELAKQKMEKYLKRNYYLQSREWPYKNVKPRIIAERYMEDEESSELRDYKFFCFDGKVKMMFIATERQNKATETRFDFFDTQFNHIDMRNGHPNADKPIKKPVNFEKMIELAEILSKEIPHVRVDFYEVNGKVYFGEMTFHHWSGFVPFEPEEWDKTIGSWIKLPIEKKV